MKFIQSLLAVLIVFQGKDTFTNLSRYSNMSEKRIRRWSDHYFDFANLNTLNIRYLAADAYYSKESFVTKVVEQGFHLVGKLRSDANLKCLYQ